MPDALSAHTTSQTSLRNARHLVEHSFKIRAGETVSIVYDDIASHETDAYTLAEATRERGAAAVLINNHNQVEQFLADPLTFPPPPPASMTDVMANSDAIMLITDFEWVLALFYVNYAATALARRKGARTAALEQGLGEMHVSVLEMERTTARVWEASRRLQGAKSVHVTSRGGTDIRLSLEGRKPVHNAPIVPPGDIVNLVPFYGETAFAPAESIGDGRIVLDGMMLGTGVGPHTETATTDARRVPAGIRTRFVETPVVLELKAGRCMGVTGGKEADRLRELFAEIPDANIMGEFALGLSTVGPFSQAGMTACLGTAHFAFGDNITYGGHVACPLHQNGVIQNASIEIVDREEWLLKDGQWMSAES